MKQLALPVQLRASSVFESFFPGANAGLISRLKSIASSKTSLLTWLFGPNAVGKTHLLQAVCAESGARGFSAAYFPLSDGTANPAMLSGCESLSVVCLDDFDRVAGNDEWERAIFRLYTELDESRGKLIISADRAPTHLAVKLRDLSSRLGAGDIVRVQELKDEDLVSALSLRASQLGLELSPEIAQFMLRRLPRDMSTLCAALDKLDRMSLATQRALTIPFVKSVLESNAQVS